MNAGTGADAEPMLRMYTVYQGAADLPQWRYAVREWLLYHPEDGGIRAGAVLGGGSSLKVARALIPDTAGMNLGRQAGDDAHVVETWI